MEQSTKREIVNALTAYMAEHNLSQSDIATKAGVRKEYINIILKSDSNFMYDAGGKQGFIPAKHFVKLAEYCDYKTEKVYWETQPTEQFTSILANLANAKEHATSLTLIGQTGCGKSHTTSLFAKKHPHDTFIVTAGSSDSLGDLIEKIIDALKLNVGKSKSTRLRWIAFKMQELKRDGHKPMLVIDEAEYLRQPALCAMKELYDNLHEYCSLVFIGTDQLVANIEKLRRRNRSGIPQFHRRIKFGLRILPTIDRKFTLFTSDIEDKKVKDFLLQNCDNYGELHDVLVTAGRESERLNEPLTIELIRKVLNIPEGNLLW